MESLRRIVGNIKARL